MSLEQFHQHLTRTQLHPDDVKWMPVWLAEYAKHLHSAEGRLVVTENSVLTFLRSLRDRGVPAWQRLQAARSIEWYQALVLRRNDVSFAPFKLKLAELAIVEKRRGQAGEGSIPGEGHPGRLDPREPKSVQAMRARMRVLHHPKSTEEAYVGWLLRFIRHLDDDQVEKYGEPEIGQFLTDLAVLGEVTAGTRHGICVHSPLDRMAG